MDDLAIKVDDVSKVFRLPHEKATTIKSLFTNVFRGKINRSYERQQALKDISFEIKKGEFFGIVGRNGSGKSTLLKLLAGIYQPTKGNVTVKGKLVPFIELGVGFNPELSGRENVFLNGALLGFSKQQVNEMYDDVVAFAELQEHMDQKLKNYSSGMQVRLAFSMAIRARADILLVDEVLAVGDADFQRKCFDYFRGLKKSETTVVFVTHDMDSVREYCDRAILVESSEIVSKGSAQKIAAEYSRLFTDKELKVSSHENSKQKRWGNQSIRIKESNVRLSADQTKLTVETTLITDKLSVGPPTVGFLIKGPGGKAILGTNTKIQQRPVPPMKKAMIVKCSFTLDNILNDGVHSLDLAVIDYDGVTVCDWWEDATSFRINREHPSPYIINPDINIKIST